MDSPMTLLDSARAQTYAAMEANRRMGRSRETLSRSARDPDSGILSSSWESPDMSPARSRGTMRSKSSTRSRSPSLGRYVLDRYKNPTDSMRNNLIAAFENIELEKLLLKDENRDIREEMSILQTQFRILEASRSRDAERFELQQREVDALRLQLKVEKDGRTANANLVEDLRSDLSRKSDLLTLANEELLELRDRIRLLEKQLNEEMDAHALSERLIREHRERLEDLASALDMEKKLSRTATEDYRQEKAKSDQLSQELKSLQDEVRFIAKAVNSSLDEQADPESVKLKNAEISRDLRDILNRRNELRTKFLTTQEELSTRQAEQMTSQDQLQHLSRILKLAIKDEVIPDALFRDGIFAEQVALLENSKCQPSMQETYRSVADFLKSEVRKRTAFKEHVEKLVKTHDWKVSYSDPLALLSTLLPTWQAQRDKNRKLASKALKLQGSVAAANKSHLEARKAMQLAMMTFKNSAMTAANSKAEELVANFVASVKANYQKSRKEAEEHTTKHLKMSIARVASKHIQMKNQAVDEEKAKIAQLEASVTSLHQLLKTKETEVSGLMDEIRATESELYRKGEEIKKLQANHSSDTKKLKDDHTIEVGKLQNKMTALEAELAATVEKSRKELNQRAKEIAALDETILMKDRKLGDLAMQIKELNIRTDELKRLLEAERDPNRDAKLRAVIKNYEKETADLRAKLTEKEQLTVHLKRRVDEALNRGQKRLTEATERSRAEIAARDARIGEKERELEKLQDQVVRMGKLANRTPLAATDASIKQIKQMSTARVSSSDRATVLRPQPVVRDLSNAKSVSGADKLPPIVPAGNVGADSSSNAQLTRRYTARSGSEGPMRRTRLNSSASQVR